MSHPDPNADFVEQVLDAVRRMASSGGPVADVDVADATGLHLPTVRAVLDMEDGATVTVRRGGRDDAWEVTPR